jgi:hypothetical protein
MTLLISPDLQEWSGIVRNFAEAAVLVGGGTGAGFTLVKWWRERSDRATDVLLRLEKDFQRRSLRKGRDLIENKSEYDRAKAQISEQGRELDEVLRFYVVLYGVYTAKQVPEKALSICFQYWLAHYFRCDRKEFRGYVNDYYPTLKKWLEKDFYESNNGSCEGFFRPAELFGENETIKTLTE